MLPDELAPETPEAPGEPVVEVSVEVPVEMPDASMPEPALEPAVPAADAGAVPSDTTAELAGAMAELESVKAERDTLIGQLSALTVEVERQKLAMTACDAECASLREKLANYELGAALADQGLPTSLSSLVTTLYHADRSKNARVPGIREWLPAAMADASSPAFALSALKGSAPRDPSINPPVDSTASGLRPFPLFRG